MTQTSILLDQARLDYTNALNVLTLVEMRIISVSAEDLMYAYLVATEWCNWFKNPDAEGSPLTKFGPNHPDYSSVLSMMEDSVRNLEDNLMMEMPAVYIVFSQLNPNLVAISKQEDKSGVLESTKRYIKSLELTANFYKERDGRDAFLNKLKA